VSTARLARHDLTAFRVVIEHDVVRLDCQNGGRKADDQRCCTRYFCMVCSFWAALPSKYPKCLTPKSQLWHDVRPVRRQNEGTTVLLQSLGPGLLGSHSNNQSEYE
jgi:hypothetical protein